jgi:hypothetical protein
MKKIIITMIVVLTAMTTWAQNQTSEHLTFKGVPIDGKLSEYVLKMQKNGFTHVSTKDGAALLKGDFAAYKGCTIGVATLKQTDLVSKISVVFPECETWSSLSSNYFSLKEMLTEKYGKPSEIVEEFQTYSEPADDRSKMHEVIMGTCKYYSIFEIDKGKIELSINGSREGRFVILSYYDKINSDIIKSKALEDL